MELFACGFNAWNQLLFSDDPRSVHENEPHDFMEFQCVIKDENIKVLRAGFSSTLVQISSGLRLAGMPDEFTKHIHKNPERASRIAEAGNGKIAFVHGYGCDQEMRQYNSWAEYPDRPVSAWITGNPGVQQLVAGQTFFTALTVDGKVLTWGDERYSACLGRDVSRLEPSSSALTPHPVPDLASLPTGPITKVCSRGYITAALTEGKDLYLWGMKPPGSNSLQLSSEPAPLDLNGLDVLDVGVGDGHVIILTTDGKNRRIWVTGDGRNGQLGLGAEFEKVGVWKEVEFRTRIGDGSEVVGVVAGPKSSFVLARVSPK